VDAVRDVMKADADLAAIPIAARAAIVRARTAAAVLVPDRGAMGAGTNAVIVATVAVAKSAPSPWCRCWN
jgi:hypothetical protein